jgi:CHASE2 domain-containing sensor protein
MDNPKRYRELLVILCIAGLLALNYPLLSLADRLWLPLGIPLLYLYLFLVWLLLIVVLALFTRRNSRSVDDD